MPIREQLFPTDDQTLFVPYQFGAAPDLGVAISPGLQEKSFDGNLEVNNKTPDVRVRGRALACLSHSGKLWSVTLRCKKSVIPDEVPYEAIAGLPPSWRTTFTPKPFSVGQRGDEKFLFSIEELVTTVMSELVLSSPSAPEALLRAGTDAGNRCWGLSSKDASDLAANMPTRGLLLLAGETGVAKSQTARGLIDAMLAASIRNSVNQDGSGGGKPPHTWRRKHLVTLEDPIEDPPLRWGDTAKDPPLPLEDVRALQRHGIDYTPRSVGVDIGSVSLGLRDALRQKPMIVYVGEIRDHSDWDPVLHFAGTGHLVVTTAHAGSLVEAMENVLRHMGAMDPLRRSMVASRIRAIIHLKNIRVGGKDATVPAIWRNTGPGVSRLVAEGLGSLIPGVGDSMRGRRAVAKILLGCVRDLDPPDQDVGDQLDEACLAADVRGE